VSYSEKRRYPRLPVLVECQVEGASGRATMRLTDLSPKGCFVDTTMTFPPGPVVTLVATLGEAEVTLAGRVVPMQQSGYGFGIEFTDLDDATQEKLDAYIQKAGS
jgi:hypothetical protein